MTASADTTPLRLRRGAIAVMDPFGVLAAKHQLKDERKLSPRGVPERYLYSPDMNYRYAFSRWWGLEDLARSVVWVMLNPATGDTDGKRDQHSSGR